MNYKLFIHIVMLLLAGLIVACKEEDDIGDLYGQWQLTEVHLGTATQYPTRAFIAFQNDCVFARLTEVDDHYTEAITGGFRQYGDSISLCFYIDDQKEGAEIVHSYLSEYFFFPEPHNDIPFAIRQIDSDRLILSQKECEWILRSY